MKPLIAIVVGVALCCAGLLHPRLAAAAVCGDGILDPNEECDPGGAVHAFGDPSQATCGFGGSSIPGSECFFDFTCCKFNCQYANPGPCFDGNQCTTNDLCDNVGHCNQGTAVASGTACGDPTSSACNLPDTCDGAGTCSPNLVAAGTACGPPPSGECDAADSCDGAGTCVAQVPPAGTPAPTQCNDGNACTADQCDGSGGCQHPGAPAGTACGDPGSGQCDHPDSCDGTGSCLPNHVSDGTSCNDGLFCTVTDTCQGGVCVGAGDPCAGKPLCQNVCNETAHNCIVPLGGSCDDGNACNGTATCDSTGACIPGTPLPDGSSCDDHNPCTLLDTCTGQQCDGGPTFVARRKAKLNNVPTINADLAAWDVAGGVTIGKNGFMPDATSVTGNKVKLGGATSVFDVRANIVSHKGAIIRGTTGPVVLPLTSAFCTTPAFACGGADVLLGVGEHRAITPGPYRNVVLGENATLDLAPGTYDVCSVKAGRGTRMTFLAGGRSVFKVTSVLRILDQSFFGPASGALRPVVYVGGPLASFGSYDQVITHVIAPNGKVGVGLGATYDGSICGHDLKGAWRVSLSCTDTGTP